MLMPPSWSPIWVVFALYLFYLMGNALESEWGEFRYNFFILVGWFATVAVSFIYPGNFSTNSYVLGSVFLAFAYLYPDFVIHLFFILPIKIKWLALIAWAGYGLTLIMGGWLDRLLVGAAILNFLLFFGKDILLTMKSRKRRMEFDARKLRDDSLPFHSCTVCGITDKQAPDMDFRVCAECSGDHEYCAKHIHAHPHKT
jgi:hypothetical protein